MRIAEIIERLGRTVFEAPFGTMSQAMGDSPEVAEIRIAVLDEVKKKIQRAFENLQLYVCAHSPKASRTSVIVSDACCCAVRLPLASTASTSSGLLS